MVHFPLYYLAFTCLLRLCNSVLSWLETTSDLYCFASEISYRDESSIRHSLPATMNLPRVPSMTFTSPCAIQDHLRLTHIFTR